MTRTSDRMRRLMEPFPSWIPFLGAVVILVELFVLLPEAAGGGFAAEPRPAPSVVTIVTAVPVRPSPPEPSPTPTRATPTPSPSGPEVERIPEGTVVKLRRYPGRGSSVIGRVTDPKTGLSFAELGSPWRPSRPINDGPIKDGRYNLRQALVTETYGPDDDREWWADIDSQHLWSDLDAGDSLYDAARAMLDYKQDAGFPGGTRGRDIASQPVRRGWLLARMMEMPPSPDGRKARRELSIAIAVDTGRPRPAVLWITIPDTHRRLWPDVDTLVKSLKVVPRR
ncbi:hypothetical protein [Nonomuraea sp. SYSU D8015]|uniref:hypothetical protein n=1 Tax=Nonomuraea sp. SYSU D8015 TaxID=2593644 RepID=UPI001661556D|nr:hypothetical protein [Nonomuraea sp. SYSU D8015]